MRSESVFKNSEVGLNRFELCHQVFKAVRKLHNPGNRIQDTTNDALHCLAGVVHEEVSVIPEDASAAIPKATQE